MTSYCCPFIDLPAGRTYAGMMLNISNMTEAKFRINLENRGRKTTKPRIPLCLSFYILATGMISAQDAYSELKASELNNFVHHIFLMITINQRIYYTLIVVELSLKYTKPPTYNKLH